MLIHEVTIFTTIAQSNMYVGLEVSVVTINTTGRAYVITYITFASAAYNFFISITMSTLGTTISTIGTQMRL